MAVVVRKWVTHIEEVAIEGASPRPLQRPLRLAAAAAICSNPYAGRYSEDLLELIDFGEHLGDELARRCHDALGTEAEAYGKGGIVGMAGELEHVAAVIHPKFGTPVRTRLGGVSILPSVVKRAGPGATLDVPLHHKRAMLVRSHFNGVEVHVPDAPGPDELLIVLAVADGARPRARVGGLAAEDVVGADGIR